MENFFYTIIIITVSCLLACGIFLIIKILKNAHENEIYRKKYINNIHDDFDIKNDIHDKYNIYIQPYISKHSFSQAGKPQLLRDYFIKQVFIKNTEEPRVFCILGDTGTGKTAALVHLYYDYINSHTPNNLPYDIKLVSLRLNNAFQTIKEIEEKRNCILLLDAVDENQMAQEPKESEKYKSFIQQLEEAYENFAFVVTTCRPQFFANEKEEFNITNIRTSKSWIKVTKLYLLPFNNKQISEYLDNLFSFRTDDKLRHKAEVLIHEYPFLTRRPLGLIYIREIVESDRNINTTFELYDTIVYSILKRDIYKALGLKDDNEKINKWWEASSLVAKKMYEKQKLNITDSELDRILPNDIEKQFKQRSLLTRFGNEFHFSHKSFFEYFMAYRFLQHPDEIEQVYGMDFALQIYDDALQAWSEQKDTTFADLKNTRPYTVASSLNRVGYALDDINHFSKAERYYQLALAFFNKLEEDDPDTFKDDIAAVLNNLANLHRNINQMDKADAEYNVVLTTYRQLADKNPDVYLPYVAATLNNLATLHYSTNQLDKAEKKYNEALTTYRQLAEKNPDAYLSYVAGTLNNLAVLHRATNQLDKAEEEYNEALTIRRQLADKNPDAYLPDVAMTLNNLAVLHSDTGQLNKAEEEYNVALTIRRQLADKNPDAYLPDVAMTLNNLANLHSDSSQMDIAEAEYNEALTIRRQLADKNPDAYLPYVAGTLNNLAILHRNTDQYKEAEKEYNEALTTYRQLSNDNKDAYVPQNSSTQENPTTLPSSTNRNKQAEERFNEALKTYQLLADMNPDAYLPDVAMTLFNMALLHLDRKEYPAAETVAQESLEKYRIMAEKSHAAFDPYVKKAKELLEDIRKAKEADAYVKKAKELLEDILKAKEADE